MGTARRAAWLLVGLLAACSGSDETDAGPGEADAGRGDTGEAPDSGADLADAGAPDTGADDGNDGFEEAVDAHKNTDIGVPGAISWPGDRDYYAFEGEAGEFVSVFTTSTPGLSGLQVDTVIRLYDASMNQLAENDDSVPRVDVNSEIIHRLPAAGRYFVEVLEWSDWAGDTPEGDPELRYRLQIRTVNDRNPGVTVETEAGNDAASAIDAELVQRVGLVCGGFEDTADVDVYAISQPSLGRYLFLQTMPAGPDGYGSTTPVGAAWLTDSTGADTIARLDLSGDQASFSPATPPGDYLLWVSHPGEAGANDFYVAKAFLLEDNDPETEPNDSRLLAEHRPLISRQAQMDRADFVLARLPEGDVDYFAIDPASSESITVVCGSQTAGSGVRGLTVELQDARGALLASATETETELAVIEGLTTTSTTVFVRLSKAGQAPDLSGDFVRCGISAAIE